ncbi:AraC family transcriptional regulator [Flavitalea sp. BT771]|uniref:AraC family transcriptional regulator n=1 Tax=Flavitalea sp. BT771 TaxID=3063329 RepID=UPI0026E2858B|nr:AraC family transcriptional regulator [Flavitalea sp. BT771]MDO6432963.1 AraC family transcriptional regulator [Flavitalea sp. BT771]MDV6221761.1 AraC family transcriptional regulator [Flavitalea sp. BT771]
MFEITLKEQTGFLKLFADLVGSKVEKGMVKVPKDKGNGYIRGLLLNPSLSMMIRNCELNQDLLSRRLHDPSANERIIMSFNNVFKNKEDVAGPHSMKDLPSVQMIRGNIDLETVYPGKTKYRSILIAIDTLYLKTLLGQGEEDNAILKNITTGNRPALFEELISPQIHTAAREIIEAAVPGSLQNFYCRIKAEEMICLLFAELYKRENAPVHSLDENDVRKIYQIRDRILSQLDTPPVLSELATAAGMSTSKLKRLFKQIFGASFFNYYQCFRMKEAARLLKEHKYTVSQVGYLLGFSNLSHFSRIFEAHIGMKPKKYSAT